MGEAAAQPLRIPPHAVVNWETTIPHGVSTIQRLGFIILLGFLFMIFSRIFDLYLAGLHIPGIAERVMVVVLLVSGSYWLPFQSAIGKRLLCFTAWMVVGVPFSVWRRGSLALLTGQWWASVLVFVAAAGLILDFRQYRRATLVMALAIFCLSLFCLHYGSQQSGRLWMGDRSRFANPNEMAQAVLIGIPFWIAVAKRSASPIGKLLAACVLLLMVYLISKTGSRGALISFAALYLVLLYHASAAGKAGLLLAGSLSLCAALAFLPSSLKDRYKTLFSQDRPEVQEPSEDYMLVSAASSTESREHLFHQSLILTARHPIFGVGVEQFSVAENDLAISQGKRKGSWIGTHNTYMQVACETGIPGLLFFLSVLLLSLKKTYVLYASTKNRPELRELSTQAEALFLALVCLSITDIFIHTAYTMLLPLLAGMAVALEHTSRPLLAQAPTTQAAIRLPAAVVKQVFPHRAPAGPPGDRPERASSAPSAGNPAPDRITA